MTALNPGVPEKVDRHWHREVVATGPTGLTYAGKVVGYLDQPSFFLEQPDGSWQAVPLSFTIERDPGAKEHVPRLIQGNAAYCAVCQRQLRLAEGTWFSVAFRSARCDGIPVSVRAGR